MPCATLFIAFGGDADQACSDIHIPSERLQQALSSKATGAINMSMHIGTTMDTTMCMNPGPTAFAAIPISAHRRHTRIGMSPVPIVGAPTDSGGGRVDRKNLKITDL